MKKIIISMLDFFIFIIFGFVFIITVFAVLTTARFFKRKRYAGGGIGRFSFVISDPTGAKNDVIAEEALLRGFLSKDFSLYRNFSESKDRYEEIIPGRVYFYSVAAHPDNAVYKSGFRKVSSLLVELKLLRKAFDIVLNNNVSFIKAHDPHLLGLNGLIMADLFGLPKILHINSDFDEKYRGTGKTSSPVFLTRGLERIFERFIMNSYDFIMADREFYKKNRTFPKNAIKKYAAIGVRVDRKYYGDIASRRDIKKELGLNGKKIVLYVGRLHTVKYTADAVKAMSIIKKEAGDAFLLLVGAGALKDELEDMARQYGIGDSVLFLGPKNHDELPDIFYTADVLIAPHGGVTLVESALSSTPIVAYDFDWHSEFLEDGKTGYLVSFRDFRALAEKTVLLLRDEALRERMGIFCREKAIRKYSRDISVENEKRVYKQLVAG